MPRPRTRCGIGTQKAPRGQHLTWAEQSPSGVKTSDAPVGLSGYRQLRRKGRWCSARIAYPRQVRAGQDEQVMELVRNDSYYYYTIQEGVKSRGISITHPALH